MENSEEGNCTARQNPPFKAMTPNLITKSSIESAAAASDTSPEVASILDKVCDWDSFDVFKLDACTGGRPLQVVTLCLLRTLGVVERLQLDVTRLSEFLAAVEGHYTPQHYHNSTHAADVVQALGAMMAADQWASALEDWERLAIIIGAAVHDLGHPGVNNDFHVRTNSEAAQAYSTLGSINENNHAALASSLLDLRGNDFFMSSTMDATEATQFKSLLKELILSTDMAHHGGVIKSFKASLQQFGSELTNWSEDARRNAALRMFLHCADISNPARPLEHCSEWGRRVQEELYGQGDKERELGLVLTPACDRGSSCPGRSQAAFIKHLMQPTIAVLAPLAPKFVETVTPHINASLEHWRALSNGCSGDCISNSSPNKLPERMGPLAGSERNCSSDVITYLAP
ncbi:putative 3',5'-cyclic phosphodiesterase pde-4 [Nannochloris sp. 'desiccata']|nr:putative 3',5'-cyclic phosphodiesterase pde-4 [Chlorella desiccata (nom. nud.)]